MLIWSLAALVPVALVFGLRLGAAWSRLDAHIAGVPPTDGLDAWEPLDGLLNEWELAQSTPHPRAG